jgi:hypothetical protein
MIYAFLGGLTIRIKANMKKERSVIAYNVETVVFVNMPSKRTVD